MQKENKLGTMPVPKLLLQMSLPIAISMFVQALYNVVDSIFVSRYSSDALTAVSLAFPIQTLIIAVAVGTGVGSSSLLSRKLGEHNTKEANQTAVTSLMLAILNYLVFAIFGIFGSHLFINAFTNDSHILSMGTTYLTICTTLSFGVFVQIACERIMQSCGYTMYNMFSQCAGAIVNIVLDPIFIFGAFGIPAMGATGAAIATVAGQIIGMLLSLFVVMFKIPDVSIRFEHFRFHKNIVKSIYVVGFPAIIMQSISSVMIMGLNMILLPFSAVAVNVLGIYFKLQNFVFMPVFGLTNGMIPIVSYNYGARKVERIKQTKKISMIVAIIIMLLGTALFQLIPDTLLQIFGADDAMLTMGSTALRIISVSFVFAGISIVASSVFQAVGNGLLSLIMSIVRQLIFLLPIAYLLIETVGVIGVWYSFLIAEVVCVIMALVFNRYINHKYIDSL
ncbi:multi antimicrobial extrusion protein (Na(+)/drug antiporter), MATE family of MDR efflux pumps [Lachnospiraceae bacterium KM106-2]|nr:multi antimicrobial extrusion protein (Na(+)/drug antiporter), MATE family of MDR efflux pumps [Lachnospiraceae bacterium KM106-2]